MAYKRKTRDVYCLLTNAGYGWECESEYTKDDYEYPRKEAFKDAKEYQLIYGVGRVKVQKRRERITNEH